MIYQCNKCKGTFPLTLKYLFKGINTGWFEQEMICPVCGEKSICRKIKPEKNRGG